MRPSDYMQRNPVSLNISRSKFKMSPRWTGTFNAYKLVPFFTYTDILPGDTMKLGNSFVIRMSTPVAPIMDDLYLDIAYYFVPHDLILSRSYMSPSTNDSNHSWKAFIGAQDSLLNMPVPDSGVKLPFMYVDRTYTTQGIADCMGMPIPKVGTSYKVNCLAPLAFMAVWNENYRDPNTQNPGVFSISNNMVYITWAAAGLTNSNVWAVASLPNVCRLHGYFGSALPWPQRNSTSVLLPLGSTAPIITGSMHSLGGILQFGTSSTGAASDDEYVALGLARPANSYDGGAFVSNTDVDNNSLSQRSVNRSNLFADLANASAVSINTFRAAVQEQRWYEALARGGNREDEMTAALFGVMPKNAGQGQPEYLGGKRIPIIISQVNVTANSSAGSENQSVGQTGAFSLTSDKDYYFTKSFDTWGSVIGVACVRYRDSFGRSLNKMFTRDERFDFYFPQFANLGETPVYQHEADIYYNQSTGDFPTSDVFGYQEAWAEYRMIPDTVSGLVRPGQSLDHWTFANSFYNENGAQTATADISLAGFLGATNATVAIDRSLVTGIAASGFQFLGQFQQDITFVRPMPLYSIPGLVDHN